MDSRRGTGADLNEPVQDWLEVSAGIAVLSEFKNIPPCTDTQDSGVSVYRLYTPSIISRDENKQVEEANVYPGWLIYREPPGRTNADPIVLGTMRELNPEIRWTQRDDNFYLGRYTDYISGMRNLDMPVAAEEVIYLLSIGILLAPRIRFILHAVLRSRPRDPVPPREIDVEYQ